MSAVKKATKIIAVILAVILLVAGISYLFLKPLYYRLFYFGDRISGTVHITIDGKEYDLQKSDVTGQQDYKNEVDVGVLNGTDGARISIHGGEYGPYSLLINVDGMSAPLEAVIYQYNWWNTSKFTLDISIDHAAETVTFTSTAQVNDTAAESRSTTVAFSDGKFKHYIVTV